MLGRSLPGLLSGLLKLNAVLVFLWYFYAFANETWEIGGVANRLVKLSGLIFLGFAGFIFLKGLRDEWKTEPRTFPRKSGGLYTVLVVAPILAVALVRLISVEHHPFSSKLLDCTETQLERFYATLR